MENKREIKYQAWDKVNKIMRNVWNITWDFNPEKPTIIIACDPVINSEYVLHEGEFELRQYIGLKDRNGKEIFEGDIIVFYTYSCPHPDSRDYKNKRKDYKGQGIKEAVRIDDGLLTPFYDGTYTEDEQGDWFQSEYGFEIIGNIYENPQLLNNQNPIGV